MMEYVVPAFAGNVASAPTPQPPSTPLSTPRVPVWTARIIRGSLPVVEARRYPSAVAVYRNQTEPRTSDDWHHDGSSTAWVASLVSCRAVNGNAVIAVAWSKSSSDGGAACATPGTSSANAAVITVAKAI